MGTEQGPWSIRLLRQMEGRSDQKSVSGQERDQVHQAPEKFSRDETGGRERGSNWRANGVMRRWCHHCF